MSKFSTRKGLGLGAVVALATTVFAGAPAAQASVAPVTLTDNTGYGTYTTLLNSSYELKSWVTAAAQNGAPIGYEIKNVGNTYANLELAVGVDNWDSSTSHWSEGVSSGRTYRTPAYWNGSQYGYNNYQNDLAISAMDYSNVGQVKLQVTAFVDTNGNGSKQDNEESASQTVTWVDGRSTTATTTIKEPTIGDSGVTAAVTLANKDINLAQLARSENKRWSYEWLEDDDNTGAIGARFTNSLSSDWYFAGLDDWCTTGFGCSFNDDNISYNSDDKTLEFYAPGTVAAGVYRATPYYWNDEVGHNADDKWIALGATAQAVVAPATVSSITDPEVTTGVDVIRHNSTDYKARTGTKTITYTSTLKNSAGDPVAAGIKAHFYIGEDSLGYGSTVKVGDKTLAANGDDLNIPVTTDANGKVSVTLTATGANSDSIYAYVTSQDHSSDSTYVNWEDTYYNLYANPSGDRWMAVNGTTTVKYIVEDQFNQPAGSDFSVLVGNNTNSYRSTQADFAYTVPVTNGVATVTIKDNGAGVGQDHIWADLYKKNANGGGSLYTGDSYWFYLDYTDAELVTPTAISANWYDYNDGVTRLSDGSVKVKPVKLSDLSKFVAGNDFQYNSNDQFSYPQSLYLTDSATSTYSYLEITGTVTGAAGVVGGTPVTISLPGAVIESASGNEENEFYAKDSITVLTDGSGDYYAYFYSDVPGKQTVTITSGGVTKTKSVTFAASAPASVALSVAGGSATAQAGRTAAVAATVKDTAGHLIPGVTVTFTAAGGAGSLSATSAVTNASGVATVNYVTGAADTGSVDFTATAGSITSAKATVSFVHSTGNVTHKSAVVTANWANAKGQNVLVTVDGYRRYNQVELSDAANFYSKKLKKGRHTINLYVGGVLVDSLKFTVKK